MSPRARIGIDAQVARIARLLAELEHLAHGKLALSSDISARRAAEAAQLQQEAA